MIILLTESGHDNGIAGLLKFAFVVFAPTGSSIFFHSQLATRECPDSEKWKQSGAKSA